MYKKTPVWKEFKGVVDGGVLLTVKTNNSMLGSISTPLQLMYTSGTQVSVSATPAAGYTMTGWTSGRTSLATSANLNIMLTQDTVVIAHFCRAGTYSVTPNQVKSIAGIAGISHLTLKGTIDARDIAFMRDSLPCLTELDLSGVTIVGYKGTEGTVSGSPETYPANEIPHLAFNTNRREVALFSVTLPSSITTISIYAFSRCCNLTHINLPASLTSIRYGAFQDCSSLSGALSIPSSVRCIERQTFYNCSSLTSVTVPTSVTGIGDEAFYGCRGLTSFSIPPAVTLIEAGTFSGCRGLTSVTIPPTMIEIAAEAFSSCISLPSITIPASVRVIGIRAFGGCHGLTSITNLSLTPQSIDKNVFQDVDIANVALLAPFSSAKKYGSAAVWKEFKQGSTSSLRLNIRVNNGELGSVTGMASGLYAVNTAVQLNALSAKGYGFLGWTSGAPESSTLIGSAAPFNFKLTQDTTLTANFGKKGSYKVSPNGLKDVFDIKAISHLTLTGTIDARDVKFMRDSMPFLTELDLSGVTIAEYAGLEGPDFFASSITAVYPANEMPHSSFYTNTTRKISLISLKLPRSIISIGSKAFSSCDKLTSITIPPLVTRIGDDVFKGCLGLISADFPSSLTAIGQSTFFSCRSLSSVTLPASLKDISYAMFNGCSGLSSITIPSLVTSIGNTAFEGCTGLTSITNLSLTPQNASYAFNNLDVSNTLLIVPTSSYKAYQSSDVWRRFKKMAIGGMLLSSQVNIVALGSVSGTASGLYTTQIDVQLTATPTNGCSFLGWAGGASASSPISGAGLSLSFKLAQDTIITAKFAKVGIHQVSPNGLKDITDITLVTHLRLTGTIDARDVKFMRDNMPFLAEADLSGATIVKYEGDEGTSNRITSYPADEMPRFSFVPPSGSSNTTLMVIKLPNNLTSIGAYAFQRCSSLFSVTIPPAVKVINPYAFGACPSLTSINIPASVVEIGESAFKDCENLASINTLQSVKTVGNSAFQRCTSLTSINFSGSLEAIGEAAFQNCESLATASIPETVETIDGSAFQNCYYLTSINIPKLTKTIGSYAFSGCIRLTSVDIPKSVKTIGSAAFNGCTGLTSVNIGGGEIGDNAFQACSNLTFVNLSDSVKTIGSNAFNACSKLTSVDIPKLVKTIGSSAFNGCSALASVNMSESVDSIGSNAFAYCNSLTSINIPPKVRVISDNAFYYCASLKSVSIPASVKAIQSNAFKMCPKLTLVGNNSATPQVINNTVFSGLKLNTCTLVVSGGAIDAYKNAPIWQDFSLIKSTIVTLDDGSGNVLSTLHVGYNDTVPVPNVPAKVGLVLVGWYKEVGCTNPWIFNANRVTRDTTLYAKWTVATYRVTFESNGGSSVNPHQVKHGTTVIKPSDPTKAGHTFGGWHSDASCSTPWDFAKSKVEKDTTLYAKWTIITYNVTFKTNGGSSVNPQQVTYNGTVVKPSNPSKTGHSFDAWYSDSLFSTPWDFTKSKVEKDTTLYAKWTIIKYNVILIANGAGVSQHVAYGDTIARPADPAKKGHTFKGWYKEAQYINPWDFGNDRVTQHIAIYAKLEINTYNVTFNANGGSSGSPQQVTYNNTVTQPSNPTKAGHTFGGWHSDALCTVLWDFAKDKVEDNTTLHAKWNINSYNVTFKTNGGSSVNPQQVTYNGTVTQPSNPTKAGHSFDGWHSDSLFSTPWDFAKSKVEKDTTLYAKWNVISYTVTFNANGGSSVSPQQVKYNDTVARPKDPTKADHNFAGWYSDAKCTAHWSFSSGKIVRDTALYARWFEKNKIIDTVTFVTNGGSRIDPQPVEKNQPIPKPENPTKAGHAFGGWHSDALCTAPWDFEKDTVKNSMTLYAKWSINIYSVAFNANGGSSVSPQQVTYGGTASKPSPDPTKAGHTFGGWHSDSLCTALWDFEKRKVEKDITLYAKWNIITYTVTFNANGGSPISPQQVKHGETASMPSPDPSKAGHSFDAWYSDSLFTAPWDFAKSKVEKDTTLYARWNIISYTVTFNANGGSPVSPQQVKYNDTVVRPQDPTKVDHNFAGWYSDAKCTAYWSFSSGKIVCDTTLYAKWFGENEIIDTVTFVTNGGSSVNPQPVERNRLIPKPEDPTKAGHTFGGWCSDELCAVLWDFEKDTVRNSMTLYAKWNINIYSVTFNANGGSPVSPQQVTYGETASMPSPDPTKAGYTFDGWHSDELCTVLWDFEKCKVEKDTTLYAKWAIGINASVYTVTFKSNGGSPVDPQQVKHGETVARPQSPAKIGYRFAGWHSNASLTKPWNFPTAMVVHNTVLYACWIDSSKTVYTVTFESNGGSPVDPQLVEENRTTPQPEASTKAGYTFDRWYSNKSCTIPWDFAKSTVARDVTLYAKWIADIDASIYTVTFKSNGGSPVDPQLVPKGERVEQPLINPERAQYKFIGWSQDSTYSLSLWNFSAPITANLTLYAQWKALAVQLDSMIINGVAMPVSGDTISYTVPCESNVQELQIVLAKTPADAHSNVGDTLRIDASRPFQHDKHVTIATSDRQQKSYLLRLEKYVNFDSIVHMQLGGRLIMIVKNTQNNGQLDLQEVIWQKKQNGHWISTGHDKFYYVTNANQLTSDTLRIRVRVADETWLSTCPYEPTPADAPEEALQAVVYPNPVAAGRTVQLKDGFFIGAKVTERYENYYLFDTRGTLVHVGKTSELRNGLTMPNFPGVYCLVLDGAAGRVEFKISVGS
jgi:uncharacterized repeat protein (TIGR02543 family)